MKQGHISLADHITRKKVEEQLTEFLGIFQGISIDNKLNQGEITFLSSWMEHNKDFINKRPFNGFVECIHGILKEGRISEDIQEKVIWLGEKIRTEHYDEIAHGLGHLAGILKGVTADTIIKKEELHGLQEWMDEYRHLETFWPFDEVEAIVSDVLSDGIIDKNEHKILMEMFGEFTE
ncbi:MAG: hypothetical protein GY804_14160 [Alphaproteobacteria bacterium]|nr:hypothetical protein [Alphaproteobacteria bacterium]